MEREQQRCDTRKPDAPSGAELEASDYPSFFKRTDARAEGGAVQVTLGARPVFVEVR